MKLLVAVLIVLLLILQYKLWIADDGYRNVNQLKKKLAVQHLENNKLQERNATLEAEVKDLKQGLEAVEERARADLGMIKKGETFFHVIEKKNTNEDTASGIDKLE